LAFKANIDDLRESPALEITKRIAEMHAGRVLAVEPNIKSMPSDICGIELVNYEKNCEMADIIVLLVEHTQFKNLKTDKFVIDTKGIL